MNPFLGLQIVESPHMTEAYEDWSRVRSPARAARRLKRGFRQNITHGRRPAALIINGVVHAHPDVVRKILERVGERHDHQMGNEI